MYIHKIVRLVYYLRRKLKILFAEIHKPSLKAQKLNVAMDKIEMGHG